ncbi:MAG: hypothetical protein AAGI37_06760 [Planctomycetota bacterium]
MSWTNPQKKLMAMACRSAGIDDNRRHLLLYQLGGRAIVNGCATSTSPKLTNADFEKLMYLIEGYAPGGQVMNHKPGHFEQKFIDGPYGRLYHRANKLSNTLQDSGVSPMGYVKKAVGRDFNGSLHNLDQDELKNAIDAMTAVIKRKGLA